MAYMSAAKVRALLKKSGAELGKESGHLASRKHGVIVGDWPGVDQGPGWLQVHHRVNGDPDVPKVNGVIPMGASDQVKYLKETNYHQILTNAGFEHKVISYAAQRPINLYRKEDWIWN